MGRQNNMWQGLVGVDDLKTVRSIKGNLSEH